MAIATSVIFDLDGTLVDSRSDIIAAFSHGLGAVGLSDEAVAAFQPQIRQLIGSPLREMYEQALVGGDDAQVEAACEAYRAHYFEHCTDRTRPFPGVVECLERLDGIPLAVATTKKTFMAVKLLTDLGLDDRFALIQGTDDIPPKPDPTLLLKVIETLGLDRSGAWMVGDTVHDIEAANRAEIRSCAVTTGATPKATLSHAKPTLIVDNLLDLSRFLLETSG